MRSLCDRETQAGEVPYLAMNSRRGRQEKNLGLLFPWTSSAASLIAAMRLTAELSVSRTAGCVNNGSKSGAGFPPLRCLGNRISVNVGLRLSCLQLFQRARVFLPVKVPLQRRPEGWFGRCRAPEQGHA